jgi:hypothetical protein
MFSCAVLGHLLQVEKFDNIQLQSNTKMNF